MTVNVFNFTDTWDDAGVVWNGIKFAVTDSASDATSRILDIIYNGNSKLYIPKSGIVTAPIGVATAVLDLTSNFDVNTGAIAVSTPSIIEQIWNGGAGVDYVGLQFNITDSSSAATSRVISVLVDAVEVFLLDKDGTLKLGNGSGLGLWVDAAETYGVIFNGGMYFGEDAGIVFMSGVPASGTLDITINRAASGVIGMTAANGTTGAVIEMGERTAPSAPGANKGRLYLQDNGAGKTQLMVLFASGAAQQIAIEP